MINPINQIIIPLEFLVMISVMLCFVGILSYYNYFRASIFKV